MVPKDKKEKKKDESDKDKKNDKQRRNSLIDSSSQSSSTSSTVDSDESSASSQQSSLYEKTQGTMTAVANETDAEQPQEGGIEKLRRSVQTVKTGDEMCKEVGFSSLSNVYPLDNTQPGKSGSGKKSSRSKKDKEKHREVEQDQRDVERGEMRRPYDYPTTDKEFGTSYSYFGSSNNRIFTGFSGRNSFCKAMVTSQGKLQAPAGFGIAATGLYDKVPEIQPRRDSALGRQEAHYSELVGSNRVNWRTMFDESYKKECKSMSTNALAIEWEDIDSLKRKLRAIALSTNKNKWMQKLLMLILDGRIKKVWRRIEAIMRVLRSRSDGPYNRMNDLPLIQLVMQRITEMLRDPDEGTNVIMYLVSRDLRARGTPCFYRSHNDCMLAELILSALPGFGTRKLLSARTNNNRRAIHFAAISGVPCQLDLLLKYDVNTNVFDRMGNAPIHYVISRNNVLMLRQLMWHGADMNLWDATRKRAPLDNINSANCDTCYYLRDRLTALERCMSSWLKALCAGKWRLGDALSNLHMVRLCADGDSDERPYESSDLKNRMSRLEREVKLISRPGKLSAVKNSPDQIIVLFLLPVVFSPFDSLMPAQYPHITRVKLASDDFARNTPAQIITDNPRLEVMKNGRPERGLMTSLFHETHNGCLYAYRSPVSIEPNEFPTVYLDIDTSQVIEPLLKSTQLFVQGHHKVTGELRSKRRDIVHRAQFFS